MKWRRRVAWFWVLVGMTVGFASVPLFLFPQRATAGPADAVVVLAGGRGERIDLGIDLASRGFGDVLVISTGTGSHVDRVNCTSETGPNNIAVLCFDPASDNTRGEAQVVADLAIKHGWDRILLVTSTYHLTRARWTFERCLELEVVPIAANPELPLPTHFNALFHEWVGLAISQSVSRSC